MSPASPSLSLSTSPLSLFPYSPSLCPPLSVYLLGFSLSPSCPSLCSPSLVCVFTWPLTLMWPVSLSLSHCGFFLSFPVAVSPFVAFFFCLWLAVSFPLVSCPCLFVHHSPVSLCVACLSPLCCYLSVYLSEFCVACPLIVHYDSAPCPSLLLPCLWVPLSPVYPNEACLSLPLLSLTCSIPPCTLR